MPLDPDGFNPYGSPDGTFLATVDKINTTTRDGTPYSNKDGFRQIAMKLKLENGKTVTKYITIDDEARDLLRALKACGVTSQEMQGAEPHHFLDEVYATQVFCGRTCEATLKTINGKDKTYQAVYMDAVGSRDAKEAKQAQAQPAVAPMRSAPLRSSHTPGRPLPHQQQPPPPQQPVAQPQPQRWGAPPPAAPRPQQGFPPPQRQVGDDPNTTEIPF